MLPATAIAYEEDTDYVELFPNVVPESWRGEVKYDGNNDVLETFYTQ